MIIREIEIPDANNYKNFYTQAMSSDYLLLTEDEAENISLEMWKSKITKSKNNKNFKTFIAIKDNEIVGSIWWSKYIHYKRRKTTGFGLYVKPEYRRLGIAQSLLDYSNEYIQSEGFIRIDITVISTNKQAIDLYIKNGFKHEGLKEKSICLENGELLDEVMLSKILK